MLLTPLSTSTTTPLFNPRTRRPVPLSPGTVVTHYRVEALLAQGEFGFVYRATDTLLLRQVAVKEYFPQALCARSENFDVVPQFAADAQALDAGREAFMQEARLLARLQHPALVPVLDAFDAHRTAYRVMPYFEGRTLAQAVRDRTQPPSPTWVRDLLTQLLGPLEALHNAGLVHGHLQPEQVLLLDDGRVMLLGFGSVRRSLDAPPSDPAYAHPGQPAPSGTLARGSWTDVYALGALGWFAATGRAPASPEEQRLDGAAANSAQELSAAFGDPQHANADRPSVVAAISRAVSPQPSLRLKTVADFRAMLRAFEANLGAMEPTAAAPAAAAKPADAAAPVRPAPVQQAFVTAAIPGRSSSASSSEEIDPAARELIARLVESIPDSHSRWTPPPVPSAEEQAWAQDVALGKSKPSRRHDESRSRSSFSRVAAAFALLLVAAAGLAAWQWDDVRAGAEKIADLMQADRTRASATAAAPPQQPHPAEAPAATLGATPSAESQRVATQALANAAVLAPTATQPVPPTPVAQQPSTTAPQPAVPGENTLPPTAAGPAAQHRVEAMEPKAQSPQPLPTASPSAQTPVAAAQGRPSASTEEYIPPPTSPQQAPAQQQARKRPPASPREVCAGRTNFSLYYCMEQQCRRSEFEANGQCVALRRTGEVQ